MRKKLSEQKGITLIALVITIIVLLILAGVAISMLSGENGILNQAANARTDTEEQSIIEQIKLAALSAITEGEGKIDEEALDAELTKAFGEGKYNKTPNEKGGWTITVGDVSYEIDGSSSDDSGEGPSEEEPDDEPVEVTIADLQKAGTAVTEKTTLTDETGDQIVIPEGFKIHEDSPTVVDEGIVVVAPDNSEFVWVPVADASTMYGTNSEGVKLGKLYDWNNLNEDGMPENLNWTETDGVMSWTATSGSGSYREPDYLSSTLSGDAVTGDSTKGIELLKELVKLEGTDDEILAQWQTNLQNEYDEMVTSVRDNKGFYVGRYETSLNESGYAQSISGATSATESAASANTWYGLYQKEKEYSINNSLTNEVGSSMIWGSQYDQMMIWMKNNGIDVTGNIEDNRNLGKDNAKTAVGTTGTTETDKINNIYDLYGNGRERTLEANSTSYRVYRGGNCYSSYSPINRDYSGPNNGDSKNSSRLTLYVK